MRQQVWRIGLIDGNGYAEFAPQGLARVKLTDKQPGILTKPLPVLFPITGLNKAYFMPKIGEKVAILTDERCEDGLILGSFYTKNNNPPVDNPNKYLIQFQDGTKIEYDTETEIFTLDIKSGLKLLLNGITAIEYNLETGFSLNVSTDIHLQGNNIYLN
ncbi:phage baseplate assembly protein V [Geminocystis sp. NIES-3709]|uniref:phage baseplate assembly protein V n=1 Tax=Geminocystis sp. NIES-3709 TaxID=1617448 RepID=UPI0005FC68D0|nr:phage baseplate assembly protein V [Geminocystis sp. NIES-3709]BAQ65559.1 phage baseplate assembly protein V [Geminocystis sp. NIES-3709]